ncbi:MAG TPA: hypothetical protein VGM22_25945 [Methylomirabilota bacterium]|jgi:hypothetical protein
MARLVPALLVALGLLLAGCATSTKSMGMGPFSNGDRLVTVVVSEDRAVVRRECVDIPSAGPILGCHLWRRVFEPGVGAVQLVKIVRFTDTMPSTLSLEIDVHELCHAIAALQPIPDPCHADNGGVIESAASAAIRWR